ncbi:zf-HC2 domain-containing protein [Bacillus aquiflavi]|uniref:Zf-HC2 domain-containing protein n=1 Tax=Bacillus aquiflavi TaxID=2672567 RepID=A0A6B3W420_9BACI|nr:zf-HC2 domain-containing protein [Bacillus aquiflavi]MBA4536970.1 zf-HC2 domain-containing protein [Bacillus aquiflavi]NEY82666.1 zf-HC2 domain-containing protein [Bacillus aquiflavi]
MDKACFIVEDLLPLYSEGLLSVETTKWLEEHLEQCEHCKELAALSKDSIVKEPVESTVDQKKMFKQINRKLSLYQIIFVTLSFIFAIQTSLLNESFGFILSYTILGLITYLFYKDMKMMFLIAFTPIFLWSLGTHIFEFSTGATEGNLGIKEIFFSFQGAILLGFSHLLFAFIGSLIGLLILKLKERG